MNESVTKYSKDFILLNSFAMELIINKLLSCLEIECIRCVVFIQLLYPKLSTVKNHP